MPIAAQDAVHALAAEVVGVLPAELRCTIDTRSLEPGATYIALRGERFDGHAFLADALARGAAAAVVDRADTLPEGLPGLVVPDTQAALMQLGALSRRHFCGAVVAITGSAGKTTTKEFMRQILRDVTHNEVAATPANENNEIGVSKVLLSLDAQSAAVVEMGARHFGDIAPLVEITRPQVSILTNIGEAHVEIFGTRERLAHTKWQIFQTGARAILSFQDDISRQRADRLPQPPIYAAIAEDREQYAVPEYYDCIVTLDEGTLTVEQPERGVLRAELHSELPGRHNRRNLAAACAAAIALGMPISAVAKAAERVQMPEGRYERRRLASGVTIIHDAYNASPSGTIASLQAFSEERAARRIVVLASMAELGAHAPEQHRRLGPALAATEAEVIFLGGASVDDLHQGAIAAGIAPQRIRHFSDNTELLEMLQPTLREGDAVFVKGSRMYRLEQVIAAVSSLPSEVG